MGSDSRRSSGSSGRKPGRKRVIITPERSREGEQGRKRDVRTVDKAQAKVKTDGSRKVRGRADSERPSPPYDSKRAAREARLARQRRMVLLRRILFGLLAVALVAGAIELYRSGVFTIREIEVEGVAELTSEEVIAAAAVPDGSTLIRFPRDEIESRLLEHPWIQEAHVSRRFPDGLFIHVEERAPVALVDTGETSFWLVDAEGVVLGQRTPDTTETVAVIRDLPDFEPVAGERSESDALANALLIAESLSAEMRALVRAVSAPSVDLTTLITLSDVEILVGSAEDIERKDAVALRIMEEQADTVVHINVRTVDRPTWRGLDTGS